MNKGRLIRVHPTSVSPFQRVDGILPKARNLTQGVTIEHMSSPSSWDSETQSCSPCSEIGWCGEGQRACQARRKRLALDQRSIITASLMDMKRESFNIRIGTLASPLRPTIYMTMWKFSRYNKYACIDYSHLGQKGGRDLHMS